MIRPRRDLIIGTGWRVGHRYARRFERCTAMWLGPLFVRLGHRPVIRWIGWRRAEWTVRRLETVRGTGCFRPLDLREVYTAPPLTIEQATARILALGL